MRASIKDFRGLASAEIAIDGLTLVSGANAAGKTSLVQALAAALTGRTVPIPGLRKADAGALVRSGAAGGEVTLATEAGAERTPVRAEARRDPLLARDVGGPPGPGEAKARRDERARLEQELRAAETDQERAGRHLDRKKEELRQAREAKETLDQLPPAEETGDDREIERARERARRAEARLNAFRQKREADRIHRSRGIAMTAAVQIEPRMLDRDAAMTFCDFRSVRAFNRAVERGDLPRAITIAGQDLWHVEQLRASLDRLAGYAPDSAAGQPRGRSGEVMVKVTVRYITKRRNRSGEERWYWQRPGYPLERLPSDPIKRYAEATRLNEWADRQRVRGTNAEDSVAAVVKLYENSDRYKDLADGTRLYYARKIKDVLKLWADLPMKEIDRKATVDFIESYATPGERRKARAVLLVIFEEAVYRGLATTNHAQGIRLKTPPKRHQVWSMEAIETWCQTLERMDWPEWKRRAVRLFFALCRYTAQRPGDVAQMQWSQYQGQMIRLRQQKTKKLIDVPCHKELRAILDRTERTSLHHLFTRPDGTPLKTHNLSQWEYEVREKAGLTELQVRDLRRTAMVRMAEAGGEIHQIAGVSGHSIESTKTILETYLPRSAEMAWAAIRRWDEGE